MNCYALHGTDKELVDCVIHFQRVCNVNGMLGSTIMKEHCDIEAEKILKGDDPACILFGDDNLPLCLMQFEDDYFGSIVYSL